MRLDPKDRKKEILAAGIKAATVKGFNKVTLQDVARQAGCVHSLVLYYFGTSKQLRRAIMSEAIRTGDTRLVAQGLAMGDSKAKRAPAELKVAALAYLGGQ